MSRSIQDSITALESSLDSCKTSLEGKEVTVETRPKVSELPALIDNIQAGGVSFEDFFKSPYTYTEFFSKPCVVLGYLLNTDSYFQSLSVSGLNGEYLYSKNASTNNSVTGEGPMMFVIVTEAQEENITITLNTYFEEEGVIHKSDPIDVSKPGLVLVNKFNRSYY